MSQGQDDTKLRKTTGGYAHWCPGCQRLHAVPFSWSFDGDWSFPTFSPSVKIEYNGDDAGQLLIGSVYRAPAAICHYRLCDGIIIYLSDSTHPFSGQSLPLPEFPEGTWR